MKNKSEIWKILSESSSPSTVKAMNLEVWIDIRDLLQELILETKRKNQ